MKSIFEEPMKSERMRSPFRWQSPPINMPPMTEAQKEMVRKVIEACLPPKKEEKEDRK